MTRRTYVLGLFLAVWSFGFACIHLAWAVGWRGGLPDSFASISDRPWFLGYDVLAGLLMYAAGAGALLLVSGRATARLRTVTRIAAVLALLRGAPALLFDVLGGDYGVVSFGADVWFTVSGVAGLLLLAGTRRSAPFAPVVSRQSRGAAVSL